jgi:hypothetical protein
MIDFVEDRILALEEATADPAAASASARPSASQPNGTPSLARRSRSGETEAVRTEWLARVERGESWRRK